MSLQSVPKERTSAPAMLLFSGCASRFLHSRPLLSLHGYVCFCDLHSSSAIPNMSSPSPPVPPHQSTVVDRIQCRAQQCSRVTRRGGYCSEHARELLGLDVKTSTLGEPGKSGLGLFTPITGQCDEVLIALCPTSPSLEKWHSFRKTVPIHANDIGSYHQRLNTVAIEGGESVKLPQERAARPDDRLA